MTIVFFSPEDLEKIKEDTKDYDLHTTSHIDIDKRTESKDE